MADRLDIVAVKIDDAGLLRSHFDEMLHIQRRERLRVEGLGRGTIV